MSVQIQPQHLKCSLLTAEVRYEDGFRFFDRCGAAILRIRTIDSEWTPVHINVETGLLTHPKLGVNLQINHEKFVFCKSDDEWISHLEAERFVGRMAETFDRIYSTIMDTFEVVDTVRLGSRYNFLAPADSIDDAQAYVARFARSPVLKDIEDAFASEVFGGVLRYEIEEPKSGYRRNVTLSACAASEATVGLLARRKRFTSAAVQVDVDMYTRPDNGHFAEAGRFLKDAFLTGREGATRILDSKLTALE